MTEMTGSRLRGSLTALVTPFRDGAFDEAAFRKFVRWQIEQGSHGLVPTGTTGESYANENKPDGATVKSYPDAAALFAAISSGEIAAVLQDLPVNSDRAGKDDSVKVVDTLPTGEQYGFAFAKENTDAQKAVDDGLAAVKESGTYDDLYEKYFPNAG